MSRPFITHLYTADPSAHVFDGRVYVYPSHDRESGIDMNEDGDQYDMADYHVFSTLSLDPPALVTDHGAVLRLADVAWAKKQLWAPDAAHKNDRYYLVFPARAADGRFRVGVAESTGGPAGPFLADPAPLAGSYSIDPAVLVDDVAAPGGDAAETETETDPAYLFFGGLWGGQLQCYQDGGEEAFDAAWQGAREPSGPGVRALGPRVARMAADMHALAETPREVFIVDAAGAPIAADDHARRFFEGPWVHKRAGTYYLSYSTGDTHLLCYATGASPYGPFTYRGRLLEPVVGWTTHHSIVEVAGRWYLFYHDASLSGGVSHLRSVRVREIWYDAAGDIVSSKPAEA